MAETKAESPAELLLAHYERNCAQIEANITDEAKKADALSIEKLVYNLALAVETWSPGQGDVQTLFERLLTGIMRLFLTTLERATGDPVSRVQIFNTFVKRSVEVGIAGEILPPREQRSSVVQPKRTLLDANGRPITRH